MTKKRKKSKSKQNPSVAETVETTILEQDPSPAPIKSPRPIQEKLKDWKWWGEQVAHLLMGMAIAAIAAFCLSYLIPLTAALPTALLMAGLSGQARELIQNWGDEYGTSDVLDSNFDAMAVLLGGYVTVMLWALLA